MKTDLLDAAAVADIATKAGYAINFTSPIIPILALSYPAMLPWVPLIETGLGDASTALKGISQDMTQTAAAPSVSAVSSLTVIPALR